MAEKLVMKEFTIGVHHVISTGPFENIKVEAHITCGSKVGATDEEFKETLKLAQAKLKEILRDTYLSQKRQTQQPQPPQQRITQE